MPSPPESRSRNAALWAAIRRAQRSCVLLALSAGVTSCALYRGVETRATEPSVEAGAAGAHYEVRPGDTLWTIAQRHDADPDELAEVNGIEDPTRLAVGQRLFIPHGAAPSSTPAGGVAAPEGATEPVSGRGPQVTVTGVAPSDTRLAWPLEGGVLLRTYQARPPVPYDGLLLAAPLGTEVLAAATGDVVHVGDEGTELGTLVIVQHDEGLLTIYGHLGSVRVRAGARVAGGEVIATVGESGRAESPQLHFQVRVGRAPEDPLTHLPPP